MAKFPILITGLDIGTSSIKIVVAQKKAAGEGLDTIYAGQRPSRGVRRGVVVDVEAAARCVQEVVKDAELAVGRKLPGAYISVGGSHIFCTPSHGLVSVSRADGNISAEDVDRVLQAARTISLSSNKEIVDVYPREFAVDGESGVKDAIGMRGVRLEAEVLIVAGFTPYLRNSDQTVLKGGLEILNRAPSVIAAAAAALSDQQKELGVAILDIGAGTSSLAVYEEGDLLHMAVLPVGSSNITNDIAIGAKTDIETAERLKIEKGICVFKGGDKKIYLSAEQGGEEAKEHSSNAGQPSFSRNLGGSSRGRDGGAAIFSQRLISKIIQERVAEIFELANKELKKISRDKKLPAGIVLTGGGVKLPRIEELARKTFQLTVSVGVPRGFDNIDQDPALAAACGLAAAGWKEQEDESGGVSPRFSMNGNGWDKIKKFFKIFIP
ncbi:MAG: cell division protein FtsA [Candidatus Nealsonbacteria bacterium DGGOD1a]|nr:MAG: cell division protein FtsA [Candidatus Nealsonbacteria bacterium DGGOD1a]